MGSAKKFKDFINSFVQEDAQLNINKIKSLKEVSESLKTQFERIKKHESVTLIAEYKKNLIGRVEINLLKGRQGHVGILGIMVKKEFRGIGLGSFLLNEIIKLSGKALNPTPKIIRLSVLATNKDAIDLYLRSGFKKVAKISQQLEFKGKLIDEIVMLLYLKQRS